MSRTRPSSEKAPYVAFVFVFSVALLTHGAAPIAGQSAPQLALSMTLPLPTNAAETIGWRTDEPTASSDSAPWPR